MIVYYYSELLTDLSFYILRCRCSSILKRECGVQRRPLDSIDGDGKQALIILRTLIPLSHFQKPIVQKAKDIAEYYEEKE